VHIQPIDVEHCDCHLRRRLNSIQQLIKPCGVVMRSVVAASSQLQCNCNCCAVLQLQWKQHASVVVSCQWRLVGSSKVTLHCSVYYSSLLRTFKKIVTAQDRQSTGGEGSYLFASQLLGLLSRVRGGTKITLGAFWNSKSSCCSTFFVKLTWLLQGREKWHFGILHWEPCLPPQKVLQWLFVVSFGTSGYM